MVITLGPDNKKNLRDKVGKVFLGLWVLAISVLLTLLMAGHIAPFVQTGVAATTANFAHTLSQSTQGWQALHVVADGCNCSNDVINRLLSRGREARLAAEGVVLVGHRPDLAQKFTAAGFAYTEMASSDVAEQIGIEAAPTLVLIDERAAIRYTGGYYARRERTEALDHSVLTAAMVGQEVKPLPVFGCAFSKRLQEAVDPLGLKY